jgi:hypothetical protein
MGIPPEKEEKIVYDEFMVWKLDYNPTMTECEGSKVKSCNCMDYKEDHKCRRTNQFCSIFNCPRLKHENRIVNIVPRDTLFKVYEGNKYKLNLKCHYYNSKEKCDFVGTCKKEFCTFLNIQERKREKKELKALYNKRIDMIISHIISNLKLGCNIIDFEFKEYGEFRVSYKQISTNNMENRFYDTTDFPKKFRSKNRLSDYCEAIMRRERKKDIAKTIPPKKKEEKSWLLWISHWAPNIENPHKYNVSYCTYKCNNKCHLNAADWKGSPEPLHECTEALCPRSEKAFKERQSERTIISGLDVDWDRLYGEPAEKKKISCVDVPNWEDTPSLNIVSENKDYISMPSTSFVGTFNSKTTTEILKEMAEATNKEFEKEKEVKNMDLPKEIEERNNWKNPRTCIKCMHEQDGGFFCSNCGNQIAPLSSEANEMELIDSIKILTEKVDKIEKEKEEKVHELKKFLESYPVNDRIDLKGFISKKDRKKWKLPKHIFIGWADRESYFTLESDETEERILNYLSTRLPEFKTFFLTQLYNKLLEKVMSKN